MVRFTLEGTIFFWFLCPGGQLLKFVWKPEIFDTRLKILCVIKKKNLSNPWRFPRGADRGARAQACYCINDSDEFDSHSRNEIFNILIFSFWYAMRGVEFRSLSKSINMEKGSVLLRMERLNTRFPGSLCLLPSYVRDTLWFTKRFDYFFFYFSRKAISLKRPCLILIK